MLNRVQIIGHLGADPEIRSTQAGKPWANFTVATSEKWTDKATGEKKEKTEWHRVTCWNEHLTKIIEQYVFKGSKVFIEGKMQTRKWQAEDGSDRYTTEIVMQGFDAKLIMLDGKRDGAGRQDPGPGEPPGPEHEGASSEFDDEIPFINNSL